jgi:hypothetical protein
LLKQWDKSVRSLDFKRTNPSGHRVLWSFISTDHMEMSPFLKIQRHDGMVASLSYVIKH